MPRSWWSRRIDSLTYLPSLIWVPPGLRTEADLHVPLAGFFARHRVTWHQGTVQQVADGGRRVVTSAGELTNDILVVASGARFLRKLPGIEHALVPCQDVRSPRRSATGWPN